LRLAYAGAVALVYPSKYEGFGLPVLEAISCGCPVITCPNASIPEVAGEAALYVNDEDVEGLTDALCEVQKPKVRNSLIAAGLEQAKKFSWSKMAKTVSSALIDTATLLRLNLKEINLNYFSRLVATRRVSWFRIGTSSEGDRNSPRQK
jgi:glycosyltransferase involved in cell wall biosynthesis